jgi:hypothetical protein
MSNPPPAPPPAGGAVPASGGQSTNPLAIVSLVCSLLCFGGLGSIAAIITGNMAKKQIAESGGTQGGEQLAQAGIIIGIVGLVLIVLYWIVLLAG